MMLLLPNGDLMIEEYTGSQSTEWYQLAPGPDGNYADGTLTQLASMSLARDAFGSVVLPNGEVMIYGGEYSGTSQAPTFISSGQIYNPATNTWKTIATIPTSLDPVNQFGDDPLELLPNGEVLAGYLAGNQTFIYNPATNVWSAGPTKLDPGVSGYVESTDEESWVKLPGAGGNILDYELWASIGQSPGYGEYLNTSNMQWKNTGPVPVPLSNTNEFELGPAILMQSGLVFQLGANGKGLSPSNTALYNPSTNSWSAGPQIPNGQQADDAPAAVLPDGNVVFAADDGPTSAATISNGGSVFTPPAQFYEFNGTSIGQMTLPANLNSDLKSDPAFVVRMLTLPNGQLAVTDATGNIWFYSEEGTPNPSWAPTITGLTNNGSTYTLSGTQINGMTEGSEYGDDVQAAENYPIIQLTSSTGKVYDATSFNWSSTGVQTGSEVTSTEFTLPAKLPVGSYSLTVDAVGISSQSISGYYDGTVFSTVPSVSGISPDIGDVAGGTTVTISGVGLANASEVDFGSDAATIVSDNGSQIVVTSPQEPIGLVNVTVTTSGGTSATTIADLYQYAVFPVVTGISTNQGPLVGGTKLTINGSGFTGATSVDFGTTAATFVVLSDTQILATSPAGSVGTVDVTVTNTFSGLSSSTSAADQFTYVAPPTVTAISPESGPIAGGTTVTITGTNLINATEVEFGNLPAAILSDENNQIVVNSPASATIGTPDVTVTTAGGTSVTSAADVFNYLSVPTVTTVSPNQGPLLGGEEVTITGTSLIDATAVDFGSSQASIFSDTNNQIVAICPTGPTTAGGIVDVRVITSYGESAKSSSDQFTYIPPPILKFISTSLFGPIAGGTKVTLIGTNLSNATAVDFGTTPATNVIDSSPVNQPGTVLTVTTPAESEGAVYVTVTTGGGSSLPIASDLFTYDAIPTITSVSPIQGPLTGGQKVTITGTAFSGATSVNFGSNQISATSFLSDTATTIVVDCPSGTSGLTNVTVTTPGGTSPTSTADQFTYVSAPVVTGLSTSAGPLTGGTTVTINGNNLANATAVEFGKKAATIISDNGSQIVVSDPAETAGTVDVTVTTIGGTSAKTTADQYTYAPVPAITGMSASTGSVSGGTAVTIVGTGLLNATVYFGANAATFAASTAATLLQVNSPAGMAGTVDVTVVTAGGTSTTSVADLFTYGSGAPPQVQSISPSSGLSSGGTSVTINGSNFTANSVVLFGTSAARQVKVVSSTQIIATAPAQGSLSSQVDVTVGTSAGTSTTSTADQYTFVAFSPATSSLFLSSSTIPSGSSISVVLQVNDVNHNNLNNPNLTVAFQLASGSGGQGTFSPATYNSATNTYSALFTGTIAGNNSIVATVDGTKVTSTTPAISVLPGQASVATSYVTLSSSTVPAGGTITATLHAVDAAGNKETTGGLLGVVNFFLANSNVQNGGFGNFPTDNNNGTYSITFTGLLPGTNTIVASIQGSNVALTAPVTVVPGQGNATTSFVTVSSPTGTVASGLGTTVTLQAVDVFGNYLKSGGLKVAFGLGGTGTASGTFSKAIDNGNGTYSATFMATTAGVNSIVAYIGGVQIAFSGFATITVTPGQVSLARSAIQVLQSSLTAGGSITVLFQAKDAAGNIVPAGNLGVGFYLTNSTGAQGTFSLVGNNGNGQYSATFMGTITGVNKVGASVDGLALASSLPSITITPGAVSLANSSILVTSPTVGLNGTTTVTLLAKDSYGNRLNTGGLSVLLLLLNPSGGSGIFTKVIDNHNGTYTATFKGLTAGDNEIFGSIDDEVVTSNPALIRVI